MKYGIRLLLIACLTGSCFFACRALNEYQPVLISEAKMEALRKVVVKETPAVSEDNTQQTEIIGDCIVDIAALKKINSDIVGWIRIPDTSVNYPILIGESDEEYLHKDFEGKESKLGAIFSYADTSRDLTDARIILFGHNMSQYKMFGELKRYVQEESFRMEHPYLYIYTEDRVMQAEIYSIFICNNTDNVLTTVPKIGSLSYRELLQAIRERNQYPDVERNDIAKYSNSQLVTLVTCSGASGTARRLLIHAVVLKEIHNICSAPSKTVIDESNGL